MMKIIKITRLATNYTFVTVLEPHNSDARLKLPYVHHLRPHQLVGAGIPKYDPLTCSARSLPLTSFMKAGSLGCEMRLIFALDMHRLRIQADLDSWLGSKI